MAKTQSPYETPKIIHPQGSKSTDKAEPRDPKRGTTKPVNVR